MVFVAEWLRRKVVVLVYAGSNPVEHTLESIGVSSRKRLRTSIVGMGRYDMEAILQGTTVTTVGSRVATTM